MNDRLNKIFELVSNNPKTSYRSLHRSIRIAVISFLRKDIEQYDHPSANSPQALVEVYSHVFTTGDVTIPPSTHFPNAEKFRELHKACCKNCNKSCSGYTVFKLLKCGWDPTFVRRPTVKRPRVYEYDRCHESVSREINSLLELHKIMQVQPDDATCIVPIKIVTKPDHILAASKLLKITFQEADAYGSDKINRALKERSLTPIKTRLVTDFRAGLFNDSLEDFPFSYATVIVGARK